MRRGPGWLVGRNIVAALVGSALLAGCACPRAGHGWRQTLNGELPALGHRNWILVADAAYPAQVSPGVETVVTGADPLEVVKAVLEAVKASPHVRPAVYVDAEIRHVTEKQAPGIDAYRKGLNELIKGVDVRAETHETLIRRLDEAARTYRVLVLKTNLAIPYTSVFVELQCGYWSDEAEQQLRNIIAPSKEKKPQP